MFSSGQYNQTLVLLTDAIDPAFGLILTAYVTLPTFPVVENTIFGGFSGSYPVPGDNTSTPVI